MADTHSMLFPRFSAARVATALKDTPVVMVNGPRQCGKTTLIREFANSGRAYITLDDDTVLEAARGDPAVSHQLRNNSRRAAASLLTAMRRTRYGSAGRSGRAYLKELRAVRYGR